MILRPVSEEVETNKVIRLYDRKAEEDARNEKAHTLARKNVPYSSDMSGNYAKDPMTKDPKKLHDYQKISLVSGNTFESLARTNPEYFNREKLKILEYSKNLVEEFNEFMKAIYGRDIDKLEDFIKEIENNYDNNDIIPKFKARFNSVIHHQLFAAYNELRKDMSEEEAYKVLMGNYFPESLTEDGLRKAIKLRLDNNKALSDALTTMLKQNYALLEISKAEADALISDLGNDSKNADALGRLKKIFEDPKLLEKYESRGYNYDFRPLGGAYVIFSVYGENFKDVDNPGKILHYIFKYDCIVDCHGNTDMDSHVVKDSYGDYRYQYSQTKPNYSAKELNDANKNEINKLYEQIVDCLNTMYNLRGLTPNENQYLQKLYRIITEFYKGTPVDNQSRASFAKTTQINLDNIFKKHMEDWKKYSNYNDFVAKYEECINNIKKLCKIKDAKADPRLEFKNGGVQAWTCQPVNTLTKKNVLYVVEVLRALKQEGFKNILVMNCNPSGVSLPADIRNDKNFKVTYSKTPTIQESSLEDVINELDILENNLAEASVQIGGSLISHYDISMHNIDELQEMYEDTMLQMMNEGAIDKIKELAKKALQIVINIWHKVVGFIKKIIASIKEKLGFHSESNEKLKKPIEIITININNNKAELVTTKCNTPQDVAKAAENSVKSIKNAIEATMKREVACMQKYDTILQRNRDLYKQRMDQQNQ